MSRWASGWSSDWVSCWPCKSTSSAPICANTPIVVGEPFTQARDFPSRSTSRFSTRRPSSSSMPRAANGDRRWRCTADANSNAPSTIVLSAPGRTTSADARSPSSNERASTTIDFPAPVSPVRTLRPGSNGRVTSAMTARSRTRSSVSTRPHPLTPSPFRRGGTLFTNAVAEVAPMQLAPQALEEALRAEANEEDGMFSAADLELLARLDRRPHLAVERHEHLVSPGRNRLDRDHRGRSEDQGSNREGVGADGGDDNRVDGRNDDGSARRHRIRRRSRRSAHDDPVRRILRDFVAIDRHLEVNDARDSALVDDDVVEDERLDASGFRALARYARLQRQARFDGVGAPHDGVQRSVEIVRTGTRQESDASQVEAHDRRIRAIEEARAAQQGAVAAQRDETVQISGRHLTERRDRPKRLDALFAVQREPERRRLLLERRQESAKIRIVGVADDQIGRASCRE